MQSRTIGAIALRPTGNAAGSYYFLSLNTGKRINRRAWTALPMPEEVVKKVHRLARRNPAGISFYDRNGNATPLPDDPDDDPINDPDYDPLEDAEDVDDDDNDDDGQDDDDDNNHPGPEADVPPQPPPVADVPTAGVDEPDDIVPSNTPTDNAIDDTPAEEAPDTPTAGVPATEPVPTTAGVPGLEPASEDADATETAGVPENDQDQDHETAG
eukprot:10633027-Ditylum_brightwellii.AAC.1